ncbi:hypothetical protein A6U86_20445 [Rhizobium sp. AC27/96]|nr:hypothetical protein A6U86_20445 [Rhizobium sp. AC27/96]
MIKIDDIDAQLLSGIISSQWIGDRGGTINLFENDCYSCKQKSWRQQLRQWFCHYITCLRIVANSDCALMLYFRIKAFYLV